MNRDTERKTAMTKRQSKLNIKNWPSRDRTSLNELEMHWPDTRGLLERVADDLYERHGDDTAQIILRAAQAGLERFRSARKAHQHDEERFAVFVAGLHDALPTETDHHAIERSLTHMQRRVLGRVSRTEPSDA